MQMITPMAEPYQLGLAKYLTSIKHADATRALAKLALYAPEERVRTAAIEGLKSRPSKESLDVLLAGFRYPLSAVSKRAAETLVKTQNKEALSQLVDVLEQPDPRAPATKQVDGKQVSFVREMVRVNHHHNCLLCHAPANTSDVPKGVLSAPVPQPSQPLPSVLQGYGSRECLAVARNAAVRLLRPHAPGDTGRSERHHQDAGETNAAESFGCTICVA
jgi:HEAT repeat protein